MDEPVIISVDLANGSIETSTDNKDTLKHAILLAAQKLGLANTQQQVQIQLLANHLYKQKVKKIRKKLSTNYAKLFYKLGQTYGFHCLSCQSPDDLQIDHIVPVSLGGRNGLENLQLLCRECNADKGIQIIDYRPQMEVIVNG